MEWLPGAKDARGVRERPIAFHHGGERIEGVAWLPASERQSAGLVIFGHGLTMDCRSAFHVPWARHLVLRHGLSAAAIDAPCHGARRAAAEGPEEIAAAYRDHWRRHGGSRIAGELQEAVRLLQDAPEVGLGPLGYRGLSLGTQFGIAFVCEVPVKAAVLGLFGLAGSRIAEAAPRVVCAPSSSSSSSTTRCTRPHRAALSSSGSAPQRKRMRARAGAHEAVPRAVHEEALAYLAEHLRRS